MKTRVRAALAVGAAVGLPCSPFRRLPGRTPRRARHPSLLGLITQSLCRRTMSRGTRSWPITAM